MEKFKIRHRLRLSFSAAALTMKQIYNEKNSPTDVKK